MTAVEYLVSCITKLEWDLLEKKIDCEEYGRIYRQNIEQAKEMEKQQIIDSHISGYDSSGESAEDYYQHYYGSNESFAKGSEKQYLSQTNTSQTEISDEEIEEMLFYHSNEYAYGFKVAIKWYREQLKKKQ